MSRTRLVGFIILVAIFLSIAFWANGEEVTVSSSVNYNNDNIHTTPHPRPLEFWETKDGFAGVLDYGLTFTQEYIVNDYIIFMRFELQNAYWWTDGSRLVVYGYNNIGKTPMADNDLQALSIFLAK